MQTQNTNGILKYLYALMLFFILTLVVTLGAQAQSTICTESNVFYVQSGGNEIRVVTLSSGATSFVTTVPAGNKVNNEVNDLAYNNQNDVIYYGSGDNVYYYDLATSTHGLLTNLAAYCGVTGCNLNEGGADYYQGKYYAIAENGAFGATYLLIVDVDVAAGGLTTTGAVTAIPLPNLRANYGGLGDLAISPTGVMYISMRPNSTFTGYLIEVPLADIANIDTYSAVSSTFPLAELGFDYAGNLWGAKFSSGAEIQMVDLNTYQYVGLAFPIVGESAKPYDLTSVACLPPVLGLAKTVTPPTNNGDGTYTVTYSVKVHNMNHQPIYDTEVIDDLAAEFGTFVAVTPTNPYEYTISAAPSVASTGGVGTATVFPNAGYTGTGPNPAQTPYGSAIVAPATNNLLDATQADVIAPYSWVVIDFDVTFIPQLGKTHFENQAYGVTDVVDDNIRGNYADDDFSHDSTALDADPENPDPTTPADPVNADDNSVPTPFDIVAEPIIGLAKDVSPDVLVRKADGTYDLTYTYYIENMGDIDLYDIELTDALTTTFPGFTYVAAAPADNQYTVNSVVVDNTTLGGVITPNTAFNGDTDQYIIALTPGDMLPIGATAQLSVSLTLNPVDTDLPLDFDNVAVVIADTINNGGRDNVTATDDSQDGTDVDPDGNDDPTDNSDPTPVSVPLPVINVGIAKDVSPDPLVRNMDGTYDLTYYLYVENFSELPLYDIEITDDLTSTFTGYTAVASNPGNNEYTVNSVVVSGTTNGTVLTANTNFDGSSDMYVVQMTAGNVLTVGGTAMIEINITINPDDADLPVVYNNTAVITADSDSNLNRDGLIATDNSQDGTDADPDGNDDPTDNNDPTPTPIPDINPVIGIAKDVVPEPLVRNADGSYNLTYILNLEAFGNVTLYDIEVMDDFSLTFPGYSYTAGTPANNEYTINSITLVNATGGAVVTPNTAFDGSSDVYVVNITSGDLMPVGSTATIEISMTINPDDVDLPVTYNNQAVAIADSEDSGVRDGQETRDLSEDGTDADPNGNGDPTDENEPTPTPIPPINPAIGIAKNAIPNTLVRNPDGTYNVSIVHKVENLGDVDLYDIFVQDELAGGVFGYTYTTSNPPLNDEEYTVVSVSILNETAGVVVTANTNYDGDTDQWMVDPSTGGVLPVGGSFEVQVDLVLNPVDLPYDQNFENISYAAADTEQDNNLTGGYDLPTAPDGNISDESTDGTDVDPDGDDNANNNTVPTPIIIPGVNPVIGLAKWADHYTAKENNDGTYETTYTLKAENLGNVDIYDMILTDDLSAEYGAYVTDADNVDDNEYAIISGPTIVSMGTNTSVALNPSYNGQPGNDNLLDYTGMDVLAIGESFVIQLTVRFNPPMGKMEFENSAYVEGDIISNDDLGDERVSDDSVDGNNVDPDGDGDPTNNTSPTPTKIDPTDPEIKVKKEVKAVEYLSDGYYRVDFEIKVENTGDTPLYDVNVTDSMNSVFDGYDVDWEIMGDPSVSFDGDDDVKKNKDYDGDDDQDLTKDEFTLDSGDKLKVKFSVKVKIWDEDGHCVIDHNDFENTVDVKGVTKDGYDFEESDGAHFTLVCRLPDTGFDMRLNMIIGATIISAVAGYIVISRR